MYRYGKRSYHTKKILLRLLAVVIVSMVVAGFWMWRDARRNSGIETATSPTVTVNEVVQKAPSITINSDYFSLELPVGWKQTEQGTQPFHFITWQGTVKEDVARSLKLYIDTIPKDFAVNRVVPTEAEGDHLSLGNVSGNCVDFAGSDPNSPSSSRNTKPVAAEWQQINFLCDLPNYLRNLIGTGSQGNINDVAVTGPKSGKHHYFFVFTDHSGRPDDTIFINILQSFRAK